jgi:hypothetical protein
MQRGFTRRLHSVGFDPPLYDTFAFITRRDAHVSPATRAFIAIAEQRLQALSRRHEDTQEHAVVASRRGPDAGSRG